MNAFQNSYVCMYVYVCILYVCTHVSLNISGVTNEPLYQSVMLNKAIGHPVKFPYGGWD